MRCEDTPARLADRLAGTLRNAEWLELEQHAQTCPACLQELQSASDIWQRLGTLKADRADSDAMRRRFEAMLNQEIRPSHVVLSAVDRGTDTRSRSAQGDGATSRSKSGPSWVRRRRAFAPLLQGAAAVLLLVAGIQVGRQTMPPSTSRPASADVSELRREVHELRQMMALSLLHQQSASERLRGVSWSSQIEGPGNEVVAALIDTLMRDENVNVRLASIDALKRFAERETVRTAAIRALGTQDSPLVQMALIDFVVETRERGAIDVLQRLSSDSLVNESVRARARAGIEHLEAA
jgi:hypothetical protein